MVLTVNGEESSYSSGLWDDIITTWLPHAHVVGQTTTVGGGRMRTSLAPQASSPSGTVVVTPVNCGARMTAARDSSCRAQCMISLRVRPIRGRRNRPQMNRQQATSHSQAEGKGAQVAQDASLGPVPECTW